jgi:hypothetical protein
MLDFTPVPFVSADMIHLVAVHLTPPCDVRATKM